MGRRCFLKPGEREGTPSSRSNLSLLRQKDQTLASGAGGRLTWLQRAILHKELASLRHPG